MNIRNNRPKQHADAHAGQYPPRLERRSNVNDAHVQRDAGSGAGGRQLAEEPPQQPERELLAIRNSRDPMGPALIYSADGMAAFIRGAKAGQFDELVH
jgi:hypothetical protein